MKILDVRSYTGKNIFCHRPVVRVVLDIGELYDKPTKDIDGFNSSLQKLFPGLKDHFCSCGHEGGFVKRLAEGTYLTHVTEHLILELQSLAGFEVHFGKSRVLKEPSVYYIVFEYVNEKCAMECLLVSVKIVNSLISGEIPAVDGLPDHLKKVAMETGFGPSTKAIYDEAKKRRIPVTALGNSSVLQLGYGKYSRFVEASLTDFPDCISVDVAGNKHLTKFILSASNIPVPYGDVAYTSQAAAAAASMIGYPVAVKPFDANQGKGVTINIPCEEEIFGAFAEASKYSNGVIVEKYIPGRDYRILVVGGRVSAVAERIPPYVIGDGVHSISELVDIENSNPLRGNDHEKPLTRILLNDAVKRVLAGYKMNSRTIPAIGEKVILRHNGNLSTGGTARDCTDDIHPYNADLAVKAAKLLHLDIAGIDMTAADISQPVSGGKGAIIEINAAPGLRMHLFPSKGEPRYVASDILNMMFPEGKPFTVPIVSVTGTNGKTTTTRLIAHIMGLTGRITGMTTTTGIRIGSEYILKGDNTGPVSAGIVLSDKRVEAAVLETARGGLVKKGLGYDLADVGVIVNMSEDHLGRDGINTLEDLAMVKALVIEAIKEDGYAVLNADDKMTSFFLERVNCNVILFSRDIRNPLITDQISSGGRAVYVRDGSIYVYSGEKEVDLLPLKEIPITFNGYADCNVENSLAAVSALSALDVPPACIRAGLKTFKPDSETNPGRLNIFDMGEFKVMLDYGHNPAGYSAVINCLSGLNAERFVGVIGMPGDRADKCIRDVGRICGKAFSRIYIKEDSDLRGRDPGEVADILYDAALSAGMGVKDITVVYSEVEALDKAILDARAGDFIVMFYEDFEPALELVERYRYEYEKSMMKNEETAAG